MSGNPFAQAVGQPIVSNNQESAIPLDKNLPQRKSLGRRMSELLGNQVEPHVGRPRVNSGQVIHDRKNSELSNKMQQLAASNDLG